jgi:hypothetical protein
MELWIRSQDKNVLVICSKLYVGGTYGNEIIEEDMCSLGEYRSSERALEVLDEIQAYLMSDTPQTNVYTMPEK